MIDIFNLSNTDNNVQVFYAATGTWQSWIKPKNCKFVSFYVLGGGGGGSGGGSGALGTARTGGGGGGSSALSRAMFTSSFIPDLLYLQVGKGGNGGGAGLKGGDAELSYVSIQPNNTSANVLLASGSIGASGGTAAGGSGVASTVFSPAIGILSYLGITSFTVGQAGAAGGAAAIGGSLSIIFPFTGGAGGGGASAANASFAGGNITGSGIIPLITGGTASGVTIANHGYVSYIPSSNTSTSRPPFCTGAGGGGSNPFATGGVGGNGAYGSGGGGGGAGVTGGAGGNGGDGIIIITAW